MQSNLTGKRKNDNAVHVLRRLLQFMAEHTMPATVTASDLPLFAYGSRPQSRSILAKYLSFDTRSNVSIYDTFGNFTDAMALRRTGNISNIRTLPNFVLHKRRTTAEEHGVNKMLDLNHGEGPLMSRMCDVSETYVYKIGHKA